MRFWPEKQALILAEMGDHRQLRALKHSVRLSLRFGRAHATDHWALGNLFLMIFTLRPFSPFNSNLPCKTAFPNHLFSGNFGSRKTEEQLLEM